MVYETDDNRNVLLLPSRLGAEKLLLLLVSSKCVLLLLQWCSICHTGSGHETNVGSEARITEAVRNGVVVRRRL